MVSSFGGCLFICVALFTGCATWKKPTEDSPEKLPAPQMTPDAVVLEMTFVNIRDSEERPYGEVWREMDEQVVPLELRRELAANGLRCGHAGTQLPARLREELDGQPDLNSLLDADAESFELGAAARYDRRQMRSGEPSTIATSKEPRPEMHVLMNREGETIGETLRQAQCMFRIRSFPMGDGRARLELTPEIHHGEYRQRWVGNEGALRLDSNRETMSFDHLRLETILAPGETLVIGTGDEPKGVGGLFFLPQPDDPALRQCLLIRLAQTQIDDAFAPGQVFAPIVTREE